MAYKFSKGDRELGDIEYESDSDTKIDFEQDYICLLYTSPSPRDAHESRMPSSA